MIDKYADVESHLLTWYSGKVSMYSFNGGAGLLVMPAGRGELNRGEKSGGGAAWDGGSLRTLVNKHGQVQSQNN